MNEPTQHKQLLLALPDRWRFEIQQYLSSKGLLLVLSSTVEEALGIVQAQKLQGLIVVSDWVTTEDGRVSELIEKVPNDMPMLLLVRHPNDYKWFELVYQPGFREYCSIPVNFSEIEFFLKVIGVMN